jgi:hypothetical protein
MNYEVSGRNQEALAMKEWVQFHQNGEDTVRTTPKMGSLAIGSQP